MDGAGSPITLALVNDYEVVVHGLNQMFQGDPRFKVVELEAGGLPSKPVDIALYDTFGDVGAPERLRRLCDVPAVGRVAVYSWDSAPGNVARALDAGAAAFVSKTVSAEELREILAQVHAGARVVAVGPVPEVADAVAPEPAMTEGRNGDWPGRSFGLTYREAEVVALISDALTNVEIAERLYLSINSVKSHIRSAYRKMGVERRSQAVRWAHGNGLARPAATSGS